MEAVQIQNLTKKYGQVSALDDLTISIKQNQIFGFVGPDGAGKTSLFRIFCGIMLPSKGSVRVLGVDVTMEPEKMKQTLGYMPQKFALYQDLTVRENLDFFAELFRTPQLGLSDRKQELLKFAGLMQFQERLAGKLSGGMKQKLALCCTLIHTPKILILDEPTTGVDPVSRQEFWEMLRPLPRQGTTVVVSTAYMDEAAKCDNIALLNEGRILSIGTPSQLKEPLRGKVFEIRGNDLEVLKEVLDRQEWLEEVQVFGDRLHVQIGEASDPEGRQKVDNFLRERGMAATVKSIEPSLEDVFVGLMNNAQ